MAASECICGGPSTAKAKFDVLLQRRRDKAAAKCPRFAWAERLPPSRVVSPIAAVGERSGLFGAVRGGGLDILKAQRPKIKLANKGLDDMDRVVFGHVVVQRLWQ